jgi:hypothetical protein
MKLYNTSEKIYNTIGKVYKTNGEFYNTNGKVEILKRLTCHNGHVWKAFHLIIICIGR